MQIRDHVKDRRAWRCRYCGNPPANNKQGQWGRACSGCKGSLTRMLRSGKYGPTYAKATKERLMGMVYDWVSGRWKAVTMVGGEVQEHGRGGQDGL